jgi:hypothetical protein
VTSVRSVKRKRSVTLDAELVAQVGEDNLSSVVNEALRHHLDEARRRAALSSWLDELLAAAGPLDECQVRSYMVMLGGPADEPVR